MKTKQELRKIYLSKLKFLTNDINQKWSNEILEKFKNSEYFKKNNYFACYYALSHEVNTIPIIEMLWKHNKKVCLPKMVGKNLEFYDIASWNDIVFDNVMKIGQPKSTCKKTNNCDIDCVIVPMLAFNKEYYRIGYGKGYYDRFLNDNKKLLKIGFAFKIQEFSSSFFVLDQWDVPLDDILVGGS